MKHLHPHAVWILMLSYFYRWLYAALIVMWGTFIFEIYGFWGFLWQHKAFTFLGVILLFLLPLYLWAKLAYRYYKYELTESGIKQERGVIWKKYTTALYSRIQNVDIHRGIMARILGLSDLHIQTAGMSGMSQRWGASNAEGRLPGLSIKDAEHLRDELIKRAQKSRSQGL